MSELHTIVRKEDPSIVFLMETRLDSRNLEFLRVRLGMSSCLGVDRHGHGGGLALLWNSSIAVHIQSYSHHHIDADVVLEDGLRWRVTGFYGHPERGLRGHSWALLRQLWGIRNLPWLVLGDFNEITALNEQWGRIDRNLAKWMLSVRLFLTAFFKTLAIMGQLSCGLIGGFLVSWFEFDWTDVSPMQSGFLFSRMLGFTMLWWRRQIIWVFLSPWIRLKLQIIAEKRNCFGLNTCGSVRQVVRMQFERGGVFRFRVLPCIQLCRKLRIVV